MRSIFRIIVLNFTIIFTTYAYSYSSLNTFVNQALENNPAVQAAESNVSAARARQCAASQPLYNPELTAQKENALENTESIGLNQTIDWANKRGAREQVGTANVDVAEAQLAQLKQQIAAEILNALAKYQAQQQIVALAKERSSLLKQLVSLTQKRYKNGDLARVDLDLTQLALSEGLAQQADAEVSANQSLQVLRARIGFTQMSLPQLSSTLPPLNSKNLDINGLITRLPSVAVLNRQYHTARARINLAERERFADPTIGIQGGQSSGDGESKRLWNITLNFPLYIRNPYKAEVAAANFDALEADGKLADSMRQAKAEVESSAERYQILYRAVAEWQQISGKPLNSGMILIKRLWQAGEITTTDYLVQLKQRTDSQIAGVELKGRAWQAWGDWLKASGEINSWLDLTTPHTGNTYS